jgi:hypothetical protein
MLDALLDPENAPAGHGIWRHEVDLKEEIWLADDDGCSLMVTADEVAALVNRLIGKIGAGMGGAEYRWGYRDGLGLMDEERLLDASDDVAGDTDLIHWDVDQMEWDFPSGLTAYLKALAAAYERNPPPLHGRD